MLSAHSAIRFASNTVLSTIVLVTFVWPANAETLPTRKSGLWEQQTTMDQGEGPREHRLTICIDDTMEKKTAAASVDHHKQNCSKYEIEADDGATRVIADCVFNERPVSSVTQMSGDFTKTFKIEIETKTTLEDKGRSRIMTRTIEQVGKYLGDDCGDLKPGEAMGSNGDRIMVQ